MLNFFMALNANTATAKDFDRAAQKKANSTWLFVILAGIIFYFFQWYAIIPAAIAVFTIFQSISATKNAARLRNGTYAIPNPNNGAPDGDASNKE